MLGMMNNEIESLTGVKSFSGGINGASLGQTATGARGAMDATSVRRMNIVRNISENLVKPLLRKWMVYNAEFLEDEEVVRVTNEKFVPVRRDDLDGSIDIDLSISTAEDDAAKVQQLSFLLQTLGAGLDPVITKELMAQILELSRLPDQAANLRKYEPQQDPMEQQMKQLAMERMKTEIEKMKADVTDKLARADDHSIDAQLRQQKVQVEAAKARNLNSTADLSDLEFLERDSGTSAKERMQELQAKHDHEMKKLQAEYLADFDKKTFGIVADHEVARLKRK
jgi:hypothetical protein